MYQVYWYLVPIPPNIEHHYYQHRIWHQGRQNPLPLSSHFPPVLCPIPRPLPEGYKDAWELLQERLGLSQSWSPQSRHPWSGAPCKSLPNPQNTCPWLPDELLTFLGVLMADSVLQVPPLSVQGPLSTFLSLCFLWNPLPACRSVSVSMRTSVRSKMCPILHARLWICILHSPHRQRPYFQTQLPSQVPGVRISASFVLTEWGEYNSSYTPSVHRQLHIFCSHGSTYTWHLSSGHPIKMTHCEVLRDWFFLHTTAWSRVTHVVAPVGTPLLFSPKEIAL